MRAHRSSSGATRSFLNENAVGRSWATVSKQELNNCTDTHAGIRIPQERGGWVPCHLFNCSNCFRCDLIGKGLTFCHPPKQNLDIWSPVLQRWFNPFIVIHFSENETNKRAEIHVQMERRVIYFCSERKLPRQ